MKGYKILISVIFLSLILSVSFVEASWTGKIIGWLGKWTASLSNCDTCVSNTAECGSFCRSLDHDAGACSYNEAECEDCCCRCVDYPTTTPPVTTNPPASTLPPGTCTEGQRECGPDTSAYYKCINGEWKRIDCPASCTGGYLQHATCNDGICNWHFVYDSDDKKIPCGGHTTLPPTPPPTPPSDNCESLGYECCDECVPGTEHSDYDDTCSGSKVCCEECEQPTPPPTPPERLVCDETVRIGENVTCVLTECETGIWVITNKEDKPLSIPIIEEIPPLEIEFGPTEKAGKILIRVLCLQSDPQNPFFIESYETEVKKGPTLTCPEECQIEEDCACLVEECNLGLFTANNYEGEPLEDYIIEFITNSYFEYDITTIATGKVEVNFGCLIPPAEGQQIINITE